MHTGRFPLSSLDHVFLSHWQVSSETRVFQEFIIWQHGEKGKSYLTSSAQNVSEAFNASRTTRLYGLGRGAQLQRCVHPFSSILREQFCTARVFMYFR